MIVETRCCIRTVLSAFVVGIITLTFALGMQNSREALAEGAEPHSLSLSEMHIKITSQGHMATFQLYDTTAASEFYDQLPLQLELENFRDAQWMLYPPKKLNVTKGEAYHDGKKGELSYYAPWGDVFMLYKDFYAGDEMHRLGIGTSGIDDIARMSGSAVIEKNEPQISGDTAMHIQVTSNGNTTVFKLNNSSAARALYRQLPMSIEVEDYGGKEKIFYPPEKLDTSGTPSAKANAGTLAYYAPWGDVVMFYKKFGSASGLYELGEAVSGSEFVRDLSGKIQIEKSSGQ
ncbi:MAG: hypothetical protein F9K32_07160 [Desulfobulbaceae bacterium]|nr:MAG: hypothetical protein F9K32_07160 [Desulfobulbaceae bacterium]